MKKILFVLPSISQTNGIARFAMNYISKMDTNKFDVSVLAGDVRASNYYKNICKEKNIKLFLCPYIREQGVRKYLKYLKEFFKEHHDYDIIYSNVANQSVFLFWYAKKYGIKHRIIHAHATKSSDSFIAKIRNNVLNHLMLKKATYKIACGEEAGKALFGKNKEFVVVNNAIDYKNYGFNETYRKEIRGNIGVKEDELLIGFVGRFCKQKNVFFFLKLLEKIDNDKIKVLMIGEGPVKEEFIKSAKEKKLEKYFIHIKETKEINKYYSALDVFVLPSLFEGLPFVAVEAQANGLLCLLSDNISKETRISNNVRFLNLANIEEWANAIFEKKATRIVENFDDKYNIDQASKKFEELIESICNQ